jgi:hypothetical protein
MKRPEPPRTFATSQVVGSSPAQASRSGNREHDRLTDPGLDEHERAKPLSVKALGSGASKQTRRRGAYGWWWSGCG